MRKAFVPLIPLVVAGSMAFSACGGSAGARATTATTNPGVPTTSTSYPYGKHHVVPKSTTPTSVPKEGPGAPVSQYVEAGQQVLIEPSGFWPQTLYANMAVQVVWTNETKVPQKVALDVIPVASTEIPPGGQFIWSPHFGGSYTYHSGSGMHGRLILQQLTPVSPPTTPTTSSP